MDRPRLSIEISQESHDRLKALLPHGTKKMVFNLIITDLIEIMETLGAGKVIGAFINRDVKLRQLSKTELE